MSHMIVFATTGDSGGPDDGSGVGHGRVEHGHWVKLRELLLRTHAHRIEQATCVPLILFLALIVVLVRIYSRQDNSLATTVRTLSG